MGVKFNRVFLYPRANYIFGKLCIDKIASLNELKTATKVELEFCVSFTEGGPFAIQMDAYLNIFEYKFKSPNRPYFLGPSTLYYDFECALDEAKVCGIKKYGAFERKYGCPAGRVRKRYCFEAGRTASSFSLSSITKFDINNS